MNCSFTTLFYIKKCSFLKIYSEKEKSAVPFGLLDISAYTKIKYIHILSIAAMCLFVCIGFAYCIAKGPRLNGSIQTRAFFNRKDQAGVCASSILTTLTVPPVAVVAAVPL